MPWSLFKKHSAKHRQSLPSIPSTIRSKHRPTAGTPAIVSVSTLSSVDDIVRSVSEANAQSSHSSSSQRQLTTSSSTSTTDSDTRNLVVQSCLCCGSKLEVLANVSYFKCTVCETLTDVASPSSSATSHPSNPLDFELLESIVSAAVETDEYEELEKFLTSLFPSIPAANHLFLLRPDKPQKTSFSRPNLDYASLSQFYTILHDTAGSSRPMKILMHIMLNLLKRPRMKFQTPGDLSFLLICLELPPLYKGSLFSASTLVGDKSATSALAGPLSTSNLGIEVIERTAGMLINSPADCRHYFLNWVLRFPLAKFQPKIELLNACIAHRLTYHYRCRYGKKRRSSRHRRSASQSSPSIGPASSSSNSRNPPSAAARRGPNYDVQRRSSPSLQTLMQQSPPPGVQNTGNARQKKRRGRPLITNEMYADDWKIKIFVRFMAILFNANASSKHKIAISAFYNTMTDFTDILHDFDDWQKASFGSVNGGSALTGPVIPTTKPPPTPVDKHRSVMNLSGEAYTAAVGDEIIDSVSYAVGGNTRSGLYSQFMLFTGSGGAVSKFFFCQYPFLLSMGSKTEILEHDALRQMEIEAQEAFFGSLVNKRHISPFMLIRVHRDRLLQDSLEALEKNEGNFRKAIRVEFIDEPGVDAGGLKKEWFLLVTRELFDPKAGYFYEEEDSHYLWFNSDESKSVKYYQLSGLTIGLALYNSTILDVNLPTVLFKKLLGCAYTFDDLITLKPEYGRGLKKMLEYKGEDFEEVFSLNFVLYTRGSQDKLVPIELVAGGESTPVTKENRQDYIRKVMNYYLDSSIRRQFEAFKQGFSMIVGGNALSLFRPEEIELLVRGSPEPIDVDALRSVTKYQHWSQNGFEAEQDQVIVWFWEFFKGLDQKNQRKLLIFVTGSDRIPATGIANMPFRISRVGNDSDRLPTAHTCFNQLCLHAYSTREKLNSKMLLAMSESHGFGIK